MYLINDYEKYFQIDYNTLAQLPKNGNLSNKLHLIENGRTSSDVIEYNISQISQSVVTAA